MFKRVLDTPLKEKEVAFNSYINKSIFLNIIYTFRFYDVFRGYR